jgi:hypothetical protein
MAEESWLRLGILLYDVLGDLPGAEEALQKAMGARDGSSPSVLNAGG